MCAICKIIYYISTWKEQFCWSI